MVGPLTFAAVFLPASRHQDILLRYDIFHRNMSNWAQSQLADIDRFNRLQTLNTAEIGYLVKSVLPQEVSNTVLGESETDQRFGDIVLSTYRNFIKVISRKLGFKINHVIFRLSRDCFRAVWDILELDFPEI